MRHTGPTVGADHQEIGMKFVHGSLDRLYRGAKSDLWPEPARALWNISK
jgi:hypothetical protein